MDDITALVQEINERAHPERWANSIRKMSSNPNACGITNESGEKAIAERAAFFAWLVGIENGDDAALAAVATKALDHYGADAPEALAEARAAAAPTPARAAAAPTPAPAAPAPEKRAFAIHNTASGGFAVVSPYNDTFVTLARKLGGKWGKLNMDGAAVNAWLFREASQREQVEALLNELYPPASTLVERTFRFHAEGQAWTSPVVDGHDLLLFSRENWRGRNLTGQPVSMMKIIEDTLECGGSRKNPSLTGTLVVTVRCRPNAVATWRGQVVEEIK